MACTYFRVLFLACDGRRRGDPNGRILRQGFRGLPILICTADEFRMARSSLDNWDNPPKDIFFTEFPLKAMQNDDYHKLKFFLIQNVQMIST